MAPPSNPDEVALGRRWDFPSVVRLATLALPFAGLAFVALVVGLAVLDAAALLDVLVPAFVVGVLGCIVLAVAGGPIARSLKERAGQRATERIEAWASGAGLEFTRMGALPEATPLLARGDSRFARNMASGELPGGLPGVLAGYVYVEEEGDNDSKSYPHTVVVARIPEALGFVSELAVRPRDGGLAGLIRRRDHPAVESAAFEERFQIDVPPDQDENWVRQLFTPSFVNWLADNAPERFFFELRDGILCVAVQREVEEPAYLERFCWTASYVAGRVRQEALEAARRPAATRFAERAKPATPSPPVERVDWNGSPPQDAATAARAFWGAAARQLRVWKTPLLYAVVAFVIGVVGTPEVMADMELADDPGDDLVISTAGLVVGAVLAVVAFAAEATRQIRNIAREYGKEAFLRVYARARDLVPEDPRSFHARHVTALLPGAAEYVLTGVVPQAGRQGSLVLSGDQARWSKSAEFLALVTPSGDERLPTVREKAGGLGVAREAGTLVVYAERDRGRPLSTEELDGFRERASDAARSFVADRVEVGAPERGGSPL